MERAQKLEPLDLLKMYGELSFEWSLKDDRIHWTGPVSRLISPDIPLVSGGSYHNLLGIEAFETRMKAIDEARHHIDGVYVCQYVLDLPHYEHTLVKEEGQIVFERGEPLYLKGALRFLDAASAVADEEVGVMPRGYDALTGYPHKEVLYENLASLIEQTAYSGISGAYLAVCIDRLTYLNAKYGYTVMKELFKGASERLRQEIRFNDAIGRTSSSCLGVVLQDCDRWGIVRTADRLTRIIEATPLSTSAGDLTLCLSAGGLVFPDHQLTAEVVMLKAEQFLFEAQANKGIGSAWTPYGESVPAVATPLNRASTRRPQ
jgi:diguanylate cyclase (GGDEF)-like protein